MWNGVFACKESVRPVTTFAKCTRNVWKLALTPPTKQFLGADQIKKMWNGG